MHDYSCAGVIPSYNNEETIIEAVESLLAQTLPLDEIIVIDDNSEDGTFSKVENLTRKYPISVYRNFCRMGTAANINKGVSFSKSRFILTMGADDVSKRNRWQIQNEALQNLQHVKVLAGNFDAINSKSEFSKYLKDDIFEPCKKCRTIFENLFWHGNFICAPSVTFERKWFMEVGGFNDLLQVTNDFELWLKASKSGVLHYDNAKVVNYRVSPNSQTYVAKSNFSYHARLARFEHQWIYEDIIRKLSVNDLDNVLTSPCCNLESIDKSWLDFDKKTLITLCHKLPLVKEIALKQILSEKHMISVDDKFIALNRVQQNNIYRDMIYWAINYG